MKKRDKENLILKVLVTNNAGLRLGNAEDMIHVLKYVFKPKYRTKKKQEWIKQDGKKLMIIFHIASLLFGIFATVIIILCTLLSTLGIVGYIIDHL